MFQDCIGQNYCHRHPQDFVSNFRRTDSWTLCRHPPRIASSRLQGEGSWSEAETAGEFQGQDDDESRSG